MTSYPEFAMTVHGVAGRMYPRHARTLELWSAQKWISEARPIKGYGAGARLQVEICFDDQCSNGHNTFAITADVRIPGRRDIEAGGCLHEDIATVFPELAPLIRWHLVNTDGPLHYVANALYLAGDRDSSGKAAGEATSWDLFVSFDGVPALHAVKPAMLKFINARREFNRTTLKTNPAHGSFVVTAVAHDHKLGETYRFEPKWTLVGYTDKWHECPWDSQAEAQAFSDSLNACALHEHRIPTRFSSGKARELDAARHVACWPDATDEQLCAPHEELKAALEARLPALMADFRAAIEAAGFAWCPEDAMVQA